MFRHSETLALFGLTAFQSVVFAKCFGDVVAFGAIPAFLAALVAAFIVSCFEMTLITKLFMNSRHCNRQRDQNE